MRPATRLHALGFRTARLALACGLIGAWAPARAASTAGAMAAVAALVGPWQISLGATERKCGMMFRSDPTPGADHVLAFPAGCRRSMPGLAEIGGWTLDADKQIVLDDRSGRPILSFAPSVDAEALTAQGPNGETYELVATGRQRYAQAVAAADAGGLQAAPLANAPAVLSPSRPARPGTAPAQDARLTPAPPLTTNAAVARYAGRINDLAGRYIILREGVAGGRDVGCMLTLEDRPVGRGALRAQLAPACRDNGIVVFEPVGWSFERGRLVLTARRGHHAMFDYHADGSWWKQSADGSRPLGLRHM